MASKKTNTNPGRAPSPPKTLRARAEEMLRTTRTEIAAMPPGDLQTLMHELQVQQVELEIQNEELRRAQVELAGSVDRYSDLYEFAPVGYLSLEPDGNILEANLTAATILGVPRQKLAGSNFTRFVAPQDQDNSYRHRQDTLSGETTRTCEVAMCRANGALFSARLESVAFRNGTRLPLHCRTALIEITERQEAGEWAIQAKRLKRMVENLPAGAIYIEDNELHMNRAAEEITGFNRTELCHREEWFKNLYGGTEKEACALYEEIRRAGFRERATSTIVRRDGEKREIEFAAHGFDGHEVWFLNDITERKRAEKALRVSEAQKEAILESLSANIAVLDRIGTVIAVNPAWKNFEIEYEGIPARCNCGVNYLDACRSTVGKWSDQAAEVADALQAILDGTGAAFSIEYPCHSGTEKRWFLLQATPLVGDTPGAVVSHIDISERVRIEEALRHEHEFNEKIIATAQTIVLVLDKDGRIVRFNPYFEKLSGWRLEETEGRDWFETFLPERDRKRIKRLFKTSVNGSPIHGSMNPILTKNGEERQIEWFDTSLTDAEGKVTGLLSTGIDVTERRLLEREVVSAAEEERQRTARELHDGLASLLTGVDYRTQALAKELSKQNLPQADEARMISGLIRESIAQTRSISKGLHPVGSHPEDLMNALRQLASHLPSTASTTCRFRCDSPVLVEDSQRANHLFRIAQEAVNNAVKHSDASRITLSLAQKKDSLVLKILDNGIGFTPGRPKSGGLGLHTMEYRSRAIDGALTIRQRRKGGTEVTCVAPVNLPGKLTSNFPNPHS